MHTYIRTSIHIRMHACMHACMHTCMHTYIHACMYAPKNHACINTYCQGTNDVWCYRFVSSMHRTWRRLFIREPRAYVFILSSLWEGEMPHVLQGRGNHEESWYEYSRKEVACFVPWTTILSSWPKVLVEVSYFIGNEVVTAIAQFFQQTSFLQYLWDMVVKSQNGHR